MKCIALSSGVPARRPVRALALTLGLALSATVAEPVHAARKPQSTAVQRADFGRAKPSVLAREVADGVIASGDHGGAHFILLDKKDARVYVFSPQGRLLAHAPALLGHAKGDHTVPGIGNKPIAQITPEQRTTPAGRFVAEMGRSSTRGEDVVWVDYDSAVSMHRVIRGTPDERRAQRLASATPADNRISYGCINLPKPFYEKWVGGVVSKGRTIVYVLPEVWNPRQVFPFLNGVTRAAYRHEAGPPPHGSMPAIGQ